MPDNILKYLITILALLQCFFTTAQNITGKATVPKNTYLIGEPVYMTLTVQVPQNQPLQFFTVDTIPHFEIIDLPKIDTLYNNNGTTLKQVIHLVSFDSGQWVLPPFVLKNGIATDSILMNIIYSTPFDPEQPYHPIKDILEVEKTKNETWWYYVVAAAVLLLLVYFLKPDKKTPVQNQQPPANPYITAMNAIQTLQQSLPAPVLLYDTLVQIFITYLLNRKGQRLQSDTVDDFTERLPQLLPDHCDIAGIKQVLLLSRFVKFAKYEPAGTENMHSISIIKNAIETIEHTINIQENPPTSNTGAA